MLCKNISFTQQDIHDASDMLHRTQMADGHLGLGLNG